MHMLPLFSIPCRHSVEAVSFQGSLVGAGAYHSTEERYYRTRTLLGSYSALIVACECIVLRQHVLHLELMQRIIDGGFTNNLPFSECPDVITVSPFPGEFDICPAQCDPYPTATQHFLDVNNMSIQVNTRNWRHILRFLLPSSEEEFSKIQDQGFTDTLTFLRNRGLQLHLVLYTYHIHIGYAQCNSCLSQL